MHVIQKDLELNQGTGWDIMRTAEEHDIGHRLEGRMLISWPAFQDLGAPAPAHPVRRECIYQNIEQISPTNSAFFF